MSAFQQNKQQAPPPFRAEDGRILSAFQARRLELLAKIREMKLAGYGPFDIRLALGISDRQYRRLDDKLAEFDGYVISVRKVYQSNLMKSMGLLHSRLEHHYKLQTSIAEDSEADSFARLEASRSATETSIAIVKLFREGVATALRELPTPLKKEIVQQPQQQ